MKKVKQKDELTEIEVQITTQLKLLSLTNDKVKQSTIKQKIIALRYKRTEIISNRRTLANAKAKLK